MLCEIKRNVEKNGVTVPATLVELNWEFWRHEQVLHDSLEGIEAAIGVRGPAANVKYMSLDNPLSTWQPRAVPSPDVLEGRYVTLTPLNAERHAAELWRGVEGHAEVWDYLADGPYADEAEMRAALEAKQSGTAAVFLAIVPRASGKAEGYASYMRMDPANGVIEVGNILMTPSLQKTTAATEAMYLMARHIFEDLGYRRYEWKCNANNAPSRRAALRYGFTFEGIFRQHMIVKGQNRDTAWFSMLAGEWPARKAAFEAWLDPANFATDGRQKKSLAKLAGC